MKIRRLKKSKKGRIEIIPMIDVMFFLLATFMLASLSMQKFEGLSIHLIEGKADKIKTEKEITFTITHNNSIFLNQEPIALEAIKSKLGKILENNQKTIIIASDKDALQGLVMKVMLNAKQAGAQNFSMIVKN
jgi:biopolymer transport protein ExbD